MSGMPQPGMPTHLGGLRVAQEDDALAIEQRPPDGDRAGAEAAEQLRDGRVEQLGWREQQRHAQRNLGAGARRPEEVTDV